MSVFIELTTDAFADTFNAQKGSSDRARRAGTGNARRPLRGLEIKDDTYGIIKVVTSAGQEIPLIDSGSPNGFNTQYTNFILQAVQEARMEKHQIVETFGESYIFFFGEAPRFLDVTAVLVDSNDFNWYAEFMENYNKFLRGTRSVELGARTYLFYEDNIVEGYMLNASAVKTSDTPLMVRLQFRMYITQYSNISFVGDPNFPVRSSIVMPQSVSDVNQFGVDEAALDAALGANLQQLGFGGGDSLTKALQNGADGSSVAPGLQGILQNAAEAFGGLGDIRSIQRSFPLRSLISDNTDEYTGAPPTATSIDEGNDDTSLTDKLQEANDLAAQALSALNSYGAKANNPRSFNQFGLGPRFGQPGIGIGQNGFAGARATFGASFGARASFGSSASAGAGQRGGMGNGFGFSGRSGARIGFGLSVRFNAGIRVGGINPQVQQSLLFGGLQGSRQGGLVNQLNAASFRDVVDLNFFRSQTGGNFGSGYSSFNGNGFSSFSFRAGPGFTNGQPNFNNQFQIFQNNLSLNSIFDKFNNNFGLTEFQGNPSRVGGFGESFAVRGSFLGGVQLGGGLFSGTGIAGGVPGGIPGSSPFSANPFSGPGIAYGPGNGANVNVGGAPSAFSMISVGGVLTPGGFQTFDNSFTQSSF